MTCGAWNAATGASEPRLWIARKRASVVVSRHIEECVDDMSWSSDPARVCSAHDAHHAAR